MNQNKIEFDKSGQIDSKFPKIKFALGENLVDCTLSGCWSVGSNSIDAIALNGIIFVRSSFGREI